MPKRRRQQGRFRVTGGNTKLPTTPPLPAASAEPAHATHAADHATSAEPADVPPAGGLARATTPTQPQEMTAEKHEDSRKAPRGQGAKRPAQPAQLPQWPAPFNCPICEAQLRASFSQGSPNGARCFNGHHYDRARQGYLNLHAVQHKTSRTPGDSPAMVQARDEFLARRWYQPLAVQLQALTATALSRQSNASGSPQYVVDLGCGTGYYSGFMHGDVVGVDISAPAIKRAARRHPTTRFGVGSTHRLPIMSGSCVLAVAVFAPFSASEAARILTPTGHLMRVAPGPTHLQELRADLFANAKEHPLPSPVAGFELSSSCRIRLRMDLAPSDVTHLIAMTPMAWRSKSTDQNTAAIRAQPITADFLIQTWQQVERSSK